MDAFAVPQQRSTPAKQTNTTKKSTNSNKKKTSSNTSQKTKKKKIAFLFLVRRTLNQPAAWEEFFNGSMGKTHSTVYCHPKDPKDVDNKMLKKAVIRENVSTAWGDLSVTRAILSLLKAALADPENTKFVLCSESCVPLCTFRELHQDVTTHQKSYFDFMALSDYINRYGQMQQPKPEQRRSRPFIPLSSFKKHATWWILDRRHAQICVTKQKQYLTTFKKVMVPDEHFFATVLWNESQQHDIICKQTTFVNWDANINWFYVKHRFCQRWGLNVLAAGSRLPKKKPGDGMYGRLPREAEKEWSRIRTLDQDMHKNDLVAHPITHGKDMTIQDLKFIYESQAYFARKFTADSNFMQIKKELLATLNTTQSKGGQSKGGQGQGQGQGQHASLRVIERKKPNLEMKSGKFTIPQYLHSQLFEEMQASLAYLRTSITTLNKKHLADTSNASNANNAKPGETKNNGNTNTGFFDQDIAQGNSSSSASRNGSSNSNFIDTSMGLPTSDHLKVPVPLIPLSALPPPPVHFIDGSVPTQPILSTQSNINATNALTSMLGMAVQQPGVFHRE